MKRDIIEGDVQQKAILKYLSRIDSYKKASQNK